MLINKVCASCGVEKPIWQFDRGFDIDGAMRYCKLCAKEYYLTYKPNFKYMSKREIYEWMNFRSKLEGEK